MQLYAKDIRYDESERERNFDHDIDIFDESEFLQKNVEQITVKFYDKYKYQELPVMLFDEPYLNEEPKISREITNFSIYIPLKGNIESLQYKPFSQYLVCYNYYATISEKENAICFEVSIKNSENLEIDNLIEKTIQNRRKDIETQYNYLKKDIEIYNDKLKKYIQNEINKLYDKVKIKSELQEKTKKSKYLKIVPKETEPIKIIEKHIETNVNINISKQANLKSESMILEENSYLQIFNTLNELAIFAQRLPKSYIKLDEEDIRDQIINALNLKLKTATASGETFNVKGKTDIIIIDNKIIYFIAECKIWKGSALFKKAIDQLLSYISEDVYYSSLIIFNKNKSLIDEVASNIIKSHKEFKNMKNKNRFIFKHPKKSQKELEISLIIFNIF